MSDRCPPLHGSAVQSGALARRVAVPFSDISSFGASPLLRISTMACFVRSSRTLRTVREASPIGPPSVALGRMNLIRNGFLVPIGLLDDEA